MDDNIELRSKKVQNIIGKIPPKIIRSGIFIIFCIFCIFFILSYIFKYPDTYNTKVSINSIPEIYKYKSQHDAYVQYIAKDKQLVNKNDIIAIFIYKDNKDTAFAVKNGILSFPGFPTVKKEQTIFTITPKKIKTFYAYILLPSSLINKIHLNTPVNIEFASFPKYEYGIITGKIEKIYSYPIEQKSSIFFNAKISLPDSLITNQNKKIPYYSDIKADGIIITDNKSIFNRILEKLFPFLYKKSTS